MFDYLDLCTIVYWYVQTSALILIHMAIIDKSMYYSLLQMGMMILIHRYSMDLCAVVLTDLYTVCGFYMGSDVPILYIAY